MNDDETTFDQVLLFKCLILATNNRDTALNNYWTMISVPPTFAVQDIKFAANNPEISTN